MPVSIEFIANKIIPSVRAYFPEGIVLINRDNDSICLQNGKELFLLLDRKMIDGNGWNPPQLDHRLREIQCRAISA